MKLGRKRVVSVNNERDLGTTVLINNAGGPTLVLHDLLVSSSYNSNDHAQLYDPVRIFTIYM